MAENRADGQHAQAQGHVAHGVGEPFQVFVHGRGRLDVMALDRLAQPGLEDDQLPDHIHDRIQSGGRPPQGRGGLASGNRRLGRQFAGLGLDFGLGGRNGAELFGQGLAQCAEHGRDIGPIQADQGANELGQVVAAQGAVVNALDGEVRVAFHENEHVAQAVGPAGRAHEQVEDAACLLGIEVGIVEVRHGIGMVEDAHEPMVSHSARRRMGSLPGAQNARRRGETNPIDAGRTGLGFAGQDAVILVVDSPVRRGAATGDAAGRAAAASWGKNGANCASRSSEVARVSGTDLLLRDVEQTQDMVPGRQGEA